MGDVYQFVYSDGNLDAPYNWYDETQNNPGAIPGQNDVAIVNYGQGLTGTLNVSTLILEQASNGPSLSLTGAGTQVTGEVVAVAGALVLDQGAALSVDTLELLGGGTTVTVQAGAQITGNSGDDASITIGTTTGVSQLLVTGINTNFSYSSAGGSLLVGDASSSNATVSITAGGAMAGTFSDVEIGAADGATATMLASGAATVVELNSLTEIGGFGTGVLRVTQGAFVSMGGGEFVVVGGSEDGTASSGTVVVTGVGSEWSTSGTVIIGETGYSTGQVTVSSGAQYQAAGDTYLESGTINVTGAGSTFAGELLQVDATTKKAVSLSNGGSVAIVTLHLDAGGVALSAADMSVRRSAYVSSGATLSGNGTVSAGIFYNSGVLDASGGTMRFIGQVNQTGAVHIEAGSTAQFDNIVLNTQTVTFEALSGTLALGDAAGFAGVIAAYKAGDTIDLLGVAATKLSVKGKALTVQDGSKTVARLAFTGGHSLANFQFGSDGHGGTDITYSSANVLPVGRESQAFSDSLSGLHAHM